MRRATDDACLTRAGASHLPASLSDFKYVPEFLVVSSRSLLTEKEKEKRDIE